MSLPEPRLVFAFEARVDVAESLHVGRGSDEVLMFTPITGGTVAGPRLNGVVVPGGGDWSTTRGGTGRRLAGCPLRRGPSCRSSCRFRRSR